MHHADADSLALFGRLAGVTRDLSLAVFLARRALPVREALDALAPGPTSARLRSSGWTRRGRGAWSGRARGAPGRAARAARDHGSNPFHAGVMLDDLDRHGRLAVVDGVVAASGTGDMPE